MYILRNKIKKFLKLVLAVALGLIILIAAAMNFSWDECVLKWQFDIGWNTKLSITEVYDDKGFHGDGERLYIVSFKGDDRSALEKWESLPMSPRINGLIYGHNDELYSTADRVGIPKVTSGKWKYIDRGVTSTGYEAFNFSICIYDDITEVIYYYTNDT